MGHRITCKWVCVIFNCIPQHSIIIGKKKNKDIQFYTEVSVGVVQGVGVVLMVPITHRWVRSRW